MTDAKIKVRVDTKTAKSELRGLNKVAAGAAKQVGGQFRRFGPAGIVGGIAGGVTGAISSGFAGATSGGFGDLAGSALGPLWENLKASALGGADLTSAAKSQAFQDLPFRLMGAAKTKEAKAKVAEMALPNFREGTRRNHERLQGIRDFAGSAQFGGITLDEANSALQEVSESLKGIFKIMSRLTFFGSPFGGGKK